MTEHDTKTKLERLRGWLARKLMRLVLTLDHGTFMLLAHEAVCFAAACAARDAGAEGDLRIRLIVDNGIDEYAMGLRREQTEDGEHNNASPPPMTIH